MKIFIPVENLSLFIVLFFVLNNNNITCVIVKFYVFNSFLTSIPLQKRIMSSVFLCKHLHLIDFCF